MPPEGSPGELSGWEDDDLLATARGNLGVGADADLPDDLRFRIGVTRLIRRRLVRAESGLTAAPAIFLLSPSPPTVNASLRSVPMLDNGLTPVDGQLWFVSPVVVHGHALEVEDWRDEAVFQFVTHELGVGCVPAVVFESRTDPPEARFYPAGLASPDVLETLRLSIAAVTLAEIFDVIERVHRTCLVTPEAQSMGGKLWEKPRRHWVSAKAEELVQLYLRTGLQGAFPSCVVRPEQTQATGRLDLELEEVDANQNLVRHALLELKVLRDYTSTGTRVSANATKTWVREGVKQAAAYRDERRVRESALCCFDMRKDVTGMACFAGVVALARRNKVALRVWHVFASSKAYREHMY